MYSSNITFKITTARHLKTHALKLIENNWISVRALKTICNQVELNYVAMVTTK